MPNFSQREMVNLVRMDMLPGDGDMREIDPESVQKRDFQIVVRKLAAVGIRNQGREGGSETREKAHTVAEPGKLTIGLGGVIKPTKVDEESEHGENASRLGAEGSDRTSRDWSFAGSKDHTTTIDQPSESATAILDATIGSQEELIVDASCQGCKV